jgi:serine/threonine-protein kinase
MEGGPRIGSYVVRGVLGQGGMGTVYLAEHAVIGKKVAIKVLKRDLAGQDTLVARFINEARANEMIKHPGIVDVFDVGKLPSGVPYIVMEYLRGESLAQRLSRGPRLKVMEAASIARETASAVGAAHAKGIIHRDLKPENLFLVRDPGPPLVEKLKVLDFGIAKLHADPNKVNTATGAVMGTPTYMSPEQCRGARDEVDQRTDVYSLGVILYEMLCGKPPFESDAFGDLLLRHMTETPAPPSAGNPGVPRALEATVLRALAKRREDRFASMHELEEALASAAGEAPERTPAPFDVRRPPAARTLTPPISSQVTPVDAAARPRRWVLGAVLVGGAAALGAVILLRGRGPEPAAVSGPQMHSAAPVGEPVPPPQPAEPDAGPPATAKPAAPPVPATEATAPSAEPKPSAAPTSAPAPKKRVRKNRIEVQQW